jgi:hypothetical protein
MLLLISLPFGINVELKESDLEDSRTIAENPGFKVSTITRMAQNMQSNVSFSLICVAVASRSCCFA